MLALLLALQVDFVRDVEPLLKAHCLKCHGATKPKAQLRLDARGPALKGGLTGPAIVPGKSSESLFIKLLTSTDPEERMPAKASALPPEKIAVLRRWIDEGAVWPDTGAPVVEAKKHWAYIKPVRPVPPRKDVAPIDAFIGARWGALKPAPEASKEALIRRVSLDLTGLPPTLEEVDAFLADPNYEKLVDRLLASPRYGERWARPWLDLARYADTNGFNIDSRRVMWKWRDWVIDAFNRDVPFDRFTIEQFAGDLLPDATEATRIATGFHRNTMLNEEGGVDPDEARWERLLDRASTTATVWLGSTYACAQCHNHKYDPIAQKDFYKLVAFFETQSETSMDFPTPEQKAKRDELARLKKEKAPKAEIDKLQKELQGIVTALVFAEKPGAEPATHLRIRGGYEARGEKVTAGVTAAFHPWPEGAPLDRLGLARWLVSPENPLVARVTVNRLWDALFGRPLVDTPEDLGTQAPPPTHPELLDWLATEFVRVGWSQKALLKTIVTSAAYKRDSRVSREHLAADPQNRLYARGARFRLEAEMIRDVQLSAAGLLSAKIGGPSVFPLQSDTSGAIAINKTDMTWKPSEGEDRYRRGLYTYWRRTAPFVAFALFDAPTREQCVVRRTRTNTPLQALSALNDPAAWDAAKALGKLMAETSLEEGFRRCTTRRPSKDELDLLERARKRDGWTMVANALLNLDETLTRE
ncbi:MAG TPA: DUF1553 domain-containing protein [Planctomycetota bacterium]